MSNINPESVGELAATGCSNSEIADILGCPEKTIGAKRFAAILAKNRAEMCKNLRQAQIKAALEGNATMLIWLGRQWLSQTQENQVQASRDPEQLIVVLEEKKKKHIADEKIDGEIEPLDAVTKV
jgi:hypothetical protein